jgi:hypothetical protein
MVCFHIGVDFFVGGGSDVTVEFEMIAEVVGSDDGVAVEMDL